MLEGRVEMDDAYLGGQRTGGKVGSGSENKVSQVAAVQTTADGKPVVMRLKMLPFTKAAMADFARRRLDPSSRVVSDGLTCFEAVKSLGIEHERTVTGGGVHSVKLPQFKAINTVLGNLKTAICGMRHLRAAALTPRQTDRKLKSAEVHRKSGTWMLRDFPNSHYKHLVPWHLHRLHLTRLSPQINRRPYV